MLGLLILLAVGLVVYWAYLVVLTAWRIARPRRLTYAWAVAHGRPGDPSELDPALAFSSFTFRASRTDLPAWDITGADPDGPTVVVTHGWGESRVGVLGIVAALAPHCSRIIAWDLPGHGEARGACRLGATEHRDLCALLDTIDSERVVLYGRSLGGVVSVGAAGSCARVSLVFAEAPYLDPATPARNTIRLQALPYRPNLAPALALVGMWAHGRVNRPDPRASARSLRVPLVVVHGSDDPVCPVGDGRALADAAPDGRMVEIPGAGHHDLWSDHAEITSKRVAEMLRMARVPDGR